MIRCAITSSGQVTRDVDWIQIRAKHLSARALFDLVQPVLTRPAKIIVNTRVDVALAAGAAGAHLPGNSPPAKVWHRIVPSGFLIGVSCHTIDEVIAAEQEGASYVLFGPVFDPLSKPVTIEPRGVGQLARAASSVMIPVLALGGITRDNAGRCIDAGAAGIAGITLFDSTKTC